MAKRKGRKKEIGFLGIAALCIGGVLVVKNLAGKQQSLAYLDYSISKLKASFSNILTPAITMVVTVTNPNATSVPVEGIFGNVYYAGSQIASFQNTSKISISGRQSSEFNLTAKLSSTAILANLISLFSNPSPSKTVEVKGMIKTGLFEQSFMQTIPLA